MADYNRDPRYLHPLLRDNLTGMLDAIKQKLPADVTAKVISVHRTPAEQFVLYKQGRTFNPASGKWEKTGSVVTNIDGFVTKSRHNYLCSTAMDIGLFQGNKYLAISPHYKQIEAGAKLMSFTWGGSWTSLVDQPHIEIPLSKFWQSIEKDNGRLWQIYLKKDGTYKKSLDGIFGSNSILALQQSTGQAERNVVAFDKLYDKHGPVTVAELFQ